MHEELARVLLSALLIGAGFAKLVRPTASREGLGTFGIDGALRGPAWAILIAVEVGLGVAVLLGSDAAAYAAAALMLVFAATMVSAILQGRAGAACGCFGPSSTVSHAAVARNLVLAAGFAALPAIPEGSLSTDQWLGIGLVTSLLLSLGLGAAVMALAREVGMLRLRLGPASALEIAEEGPPLGGRVALPGLTDRVNDDERLAVAVFTSESCRVCRTLEPAVASLAGEPSIAVQTFEEGRDADVWAALEIPGSPFVVVAGPNGAVLSKGTFNNLAQLESVIATAERRQAARGIVEAHGV